MHLYFNDHEYRRVFATCLIALIGVTIMVAALASALFTMSGQPRTDVINVTMVGMFFNGMVLLINFPRLNKLLAVRRTINDLMELLEDYTSGLGADAGVIFPGTDGFMIDAKVRTSGAFRLAVASDTGMRHMVVQRYRVDEGTEVGTLMALSELPYLQSITHFIHAHATMADRMGESSGTEKVEVMLSSSEA